MEKLIRVRTPAECHVAGSAVVDIDCSKDGLRVVLADQQRLFGIIVRFCDIAQCLEHGSTRYVVQGQSLFDIEVSSLLDGHPVTAWSNIVNGCVWFLAADNCNRVCRIVIGRDIASSEVHRLSLCADGCDVDSGCQCIVEQFGAF